MRSARRIYRAFRRSDGRIRLATLFGVSAVVTVIALLVGVLPVFAIAGDQLDADVEPKEILYGGGDGGCAFVDSTAANELHINNPTAKPGVFTDGTVTITVDVYSSDTLFSFTVNTPGFAVYDVTVNGGKKSNRYDYDGGPGPVGTDEDLHAPAKGNGQLFKLSHINFCYDVQLFFCDGTVTHATRLNDGIFTEASALLVSNSGNSCFVKEGTFVIDNEAPHVELSFGDGEGTVAGRLDITKDFGGPPPFANLKYDGRGAGFEAVPDCGIDTKLALDGDEFDDVLASDEYPHLPLSEPSHTACKVYEGENAAGIQYNVIYFEFEDPQFR
jgi:hypothetical protein